MWKNYQSVINNLNCVARLKKFPFLKVARGSTQENVINKCVYCSLKWKFMNNNNFFVIISYVYVFVLTLLAHFPFSLALIQHFTHLLSLREFPRVKSHVVSENFYCATVRISPQSNEIYLWMNYCCMVW